MENRKKLIIKLSIAFVGLLLILTFFSSTLYSINFPGVVVGFYERDTVSRVIQGAGQISFKDTTPVYATETGRIYFVVEPFDRVSEGDLLFYITTSVDVEPSIIEERVAGDQERLVRTHANMIRVSGQIASLESQLQSLSGAIIPPSIGDFRPIELPTLNTATFDQELLRLNLELEQATNNYQTNRALYDAGALPRVVLVQSIDAISVIELNIARTRENKMLAVQAFEEQQSQVISNNLFAYEEHRRALENERLANEARVRGNENERISLEQRLADHRHSLNLLAIEENEINSSINRHINRLNGENIVHVYSEIDAIVKAVNTTPINNQNVAYGTKVFELGTLTREGRYAMVQTSIYLPNDALQRPINELRREIRVRLPALGQDLEGRVIDTSYVGDRQLVTVSFETIAAIRGGERTIVTIQDVSSTISGVVPNEAIHFDRGGMFVLYVGKEESLFGHTYYARRAEVFMRIEGDNSSVLFFPIDFNESIILKSDRPITEGDRIRLVAERR